MNDNDSKDDISSTFRGKIYDNIIDTIGATPIVRLNRLMNDGGVSGNILGKCEYFNPLSSVKDRIGLAMIEAAERDGPHQRRCHNN